MNKNKDYEKLKKKIKDCKPSEYERAIRDLCKRLNY